MSVPVHWKTRPKWIWATAGYSFALASLPPTTAEDGAAVAVRDAHAMAHASRVRRKVVMGFRNAAAPRNWRSLERRAHLRGRGGDVLAEAVEQLGKAAVGGDRA